ncbi:hypothetical protein ACIOTI_42010 [Streptomyces sp. NPDC087843]|uniref:hypothetical protein n=1 Tax=Streptomyces sp. NPDC087843 TaxID=3365804 RepID=UPI0038080005
MIQNDWHAPEALPQHPDVTDRARQRNQVTAGNLVDSPRPWTQLGLKTMGLLGGMPCAAEGQNAAHSRGALLCRAEGTRQHRVTGRVAVPR